MEDYILWAIVVNTAHILLSINNPSPLQQPVDQEVISEQPQPPTIVSGPGSYQWTTLAPYNSLWTRKLSINNPSPLQQPVDQEVVNQQP